jgi:hypothetical protein
MGSSMEEPPARQESVYSETHMIAPWILVLVAGLFILYVVVIVGAVNRHYWLLLVLMTVLAVGIAGVLVNFAVLKFELNTSEVVFGFGLVKKRFQREKIVSCVPFELTFENYLGYGIRLGRDGSMAYNTRNGQGIKMQVEDMKRDYVVSVDEPAYICKLLASNEDTA